MLNVNHYLLRFSFLCYLLTVKFYRFYIIRSQLDGNILEILWMQENFLYAGRKVLVLDLITFVKRMASGIIIDFSLLENKNLLKC